MVNFRLVPVTATSWVVKPTELMTSVLPMGALSEKVPSELVETPLLVPFCSTVTPGSPSLSARLTTRPDTVWLVWARVRVGNNSPPARGSATAPQADQLRPSTAWRSLDVNRFMLIPLGF